ncbi:hypothetical protein KKHLCK_02115 [Candidatus Electrothrix laxa]
MKFSNVLYSAPAEFELFDSALRDVKSGKYLLQKAPFIQLDSVTWKKISPTLFLLIIFFFMPWRSYASPDKLTIYNESKAYQGYTIFYSMDEEAIKILDMLGAEVRTLKAPGAMNPKPLSNGNILTTVESRIQGHTLVEIDKSMNFFYQFYDQDYYFLHHDQEKTPEGNYLVLGGIFDDNYPLIKPGTLRDDFILELDPSGNIVWQWFSSDHFASFDFSDEALKIIWEGGLYDSKGEDVFHTNSIHILPENKFYDQGDDRFKPGNIVVSQRDTNIVFIIDKNSGEIVWKLGPNDSITIGQHNANMIPKGYVGAGNILIFDNGGIAGFPPQTRSSSRVIEVNSDKEVVWQYTAHNSGQAAEEFSSDFMGGAQRLLNGNTLICEADSGRIFEVTRDGEIVWEYQHTNKVYRAYRVSPEFMVQ